MLIREAASLNVCLLLVSSITGTCVVGLIVAIDSLYSELAASIIPPKVN